MVNRVLIFAVLGVSLALLQPALANAAKPNGSVSVPPSFEQKLAQARIAYFADLEGDRQAESAARQEFSALNSERPGDPVVLAYTGSLDLLEAGRTWAFWDKHVLTVQGLNELDRAVKQAPDNLEARFIRAATTWHLPFFLHRREQAESDFTYLAPRVEAASRDGSLPPQLAAAALDYYGRLLTDRSDRSGAARSFEAAVRVDSASPGGRDASRRLRGD